MANRNALTAEYVRDFLSYDPDTGIMTWRKSPSNRCKVGDVVSGIDSKGYLRIGLLRHQYRLHRIVWLHFYGRWPEGAIDHANGFRTDNRICNLRVATPLQNVVNRGKHKNNKTGYKGVFVSKPGKFTAQIMHNHKARHLGYFKTAEAAHAAYVEAARRLFGEFSNPGS